jgi:GT2 family glycosyltransferase
MSVLFVIPTLGRRPLLLQRALASVKEQAVSVDLVIVAPETADLGDVVPTYGARRVADPGRGIAAALNAGLASAVPGTTYFAWLGDDDFLAPGSLEATLGALAADPGAVLAYGWCDYVDEHDEVVFRSRAGRLASAIITFGPNLIPQPGSLMRLDAVTAVGGLDEGVHLALDLDLFLRLRRQGRFVSLPRTLASFRWHADSATVGNGAVSMEESDQLRMRYMPAGAARAYRYLRWPGRWALSAAKNRVDRNVARAAAL